MQNRELNKVYARIEALSREMHDKIDKRERKASVGFDETVRYIDRLCTVLTETITKVGKESESRSIYANQRIDAIEERQCACVEKVDEVAPDSCPFPCPLHERHRDRRARGDNRRVE
jgi:hypothetical protein